MIGIYKITNIITGKSYIGQSKDIRKRLMEHLRHNESVIDKEIQEYGYSCFETELLEECKVEELDEKEDYYIQKYDTINNGYNCVRGGQHNIGESNGRVKLSENDVYNIREAYNNHESKESVYIKYKNKVSKLYFSNLWEGHSWKHIHYDVYTKENKDYYKYKASGKEHQIFTDDEILKLRKRYEFETANEIYESVKSRCKYQTLQQILWGKTYNYLPVYDKKNKQWINT